MVVPIGKVLPEGRPVVCVEEANAQLSLKVGAAKVTTAPQTPASLLTVIFDGQVATGSSVSFTVTVKEQVAVLPEASVTKKVFVVVPTGKTLPEGSPAVWVVVAPAQLSAPIGAV